MPARARVPARRRVAVTLIVALAVAVPASFVLPVAIAALLGWDAGVLAYVCWLWPMVRSLDAAATARHAGREDPTRPSADVLLLCAASGSLVAVAFVLVRAGQGGSAELLLVALGVVSVVLSWGLVHTLFTLRYADLFYQGGGGIDFNQDEPPRYLDFAYLAFTVGMTFQVSDTVIRSSAVRRVVLMQALLSFLFGTGILATTINLVAGLSK
ncbi:MAG TPA: DUF1345 domain-containing protein [Actinomycetales bacterium]|nr:DUF1345 domain-containing protein [Actinomycetales bacterium]